MAYDIQTWVSVAAFTGGGMASANEAIGRNPEQSGDIFKSMLVGQAIAESASIFALVIALMLLFTKFPSHILSVPVLLGAGLCMGLGAIGSGVGSGFPAGAACTGMSRQPAMSSRLTTNMLIGSAVCQTPAIFSLVVSFILLFTDFSANPVSPTWAAILGAGISSGFGAIGSGLGGGLVAQASCEPVVKEFPDNP